MSEKRSSLRAAGLLRFFPAQQVEWCAVGGGLEDARGPEQLPEIIGYAVQPGVLRRGWRRITPYEEIAHEYTSKLASLWTEA